VVGEGAAPSRHAYLAFTGVYKTPLHGWCYPPICGVYYGFKLHFPKIQRQRRNVINEKESQVLVDALTGDMD
jgi:hypothetical protein